MRNDAAFKNCRLSRSRRGDEAEGFRAKKLGIVFRYHERRLRYQLVRRHAVAAVSRRDVANRQAAIGV